MGDLDFDADGIGRSGDGISASARQMHDRLQSFQSELDAHGEPWGNDDLGSLIGMCYQVISQIAMDSYGENVTALGEHGEGVTVMGANYAGSEEKSDIEVNHVREVLG